MAMDVTQREAWIRVIGYDESTGPLREAYEAMRAASASRPSAYDTPTGEAANIVRCHGLDPEGLRLAFSLSKAAHWGPLSLPWADRELLNTVTSAANQCFY
jgi:hypothetical protein